MSQHIANLGNLVINAAATSSSAITSYLSDAKFVTIMGPATLTATVTVQGSHDGGTTWGDVQSGGSDVTIATGSNSVTLSPFGYNALRVTGGSSTQQATRTFTVIKGFEVGR